MTDVAATTPPYPQTLLQSMQLWQQGLHQPAIDALRPFADEGIPSAMSTIAWFLHQTGDPGWREAIPYVERVVKLGYPIAASYVVSNMLNDANLRPKAIEILKQAMTYGLQGDPINWAFNIVQHSDAPSTADLMDLRAHPFPLAPDDWEDLVRGADETVRRIRLHEAEAADSLDTTRSYKVRIESEAEVVSERIKTQSGALFNLIQASTSRQAEAVFDEEARTLKTEERALWRIGIAVVSAAAIVAAVPLVLHYANVGPKFTSANILAAHFTAAGALGVVAGVLFARARGRDRARQRARNLTLALSTMFAYAGQIDAPEERARFTYEMGRVVIESFLRADSPAPTDEASSLLSALLARSGS